MTSQAVQPQVLRDPPWVTRLFSSTEFSWLWLIARVYIGWNWLHAGWEKLTGDGWINQHGVAIKGFWQHAVAVPATGHPAIAYDWYRHFLSFMLDHGWAVWFGPLIAVGETLVGIALLVGFFTGIAAFFGAFMNWNFMLAGTASTNPVLGLIGILVMIAWKTAGWWGLDRLTLPLFGAPWQRGTLFGGKTMLGPPTEGRGLLRPITEWLLMLAGVGIAIYALKELRGPTQVSVLCTAAALVAVTGLGWAVRLAASTQRPR
ncbi:MAG: DoxX family protein [Chloroflexi bacterium]|nr:DoxX family protein [Chloroflexota bacterium]